MVVTLPACISLTLEKCYSLRIVGSRFLLYFILTLALLPGTLFQTLKPPLTNSAITFIRTKVRMKQADNLVADNNPQSEHFSILLMPEMPIQLVIEQTISTPPLQIADVQIISERIKCSTPRHKVHCLHEGLPTSMSGLLFSVHVMSPCFPYLCMVDPEPGHPDPLFHP